MKYVSPQIYIYLQSVQAYIAPPIAACFLLGVLSTRLNGIGAMLSLISGLVLGAARLGMELGKSHLTPGSIAYWFATVNFLHFAAYLFVFSTVVLIVGSYATAPPAPARVADLTYKTAAVSPVTEDAPGMRRANVIASVVLVGIIGVLWIVFR
jgi:SSS family solute:Na+ symporter